MITITSAQRRFASWMTDVLVYIVVLNLFVEYVDSVVIDSFTISIFTAVLLKLLLDVIIGFEHRVGSYFSRQASRLLRVLGVIVSLLILFFSKFFILEAVNFAFGDHVELGHFIEIVALIVSMMATRALFQLAYDRLGLHE